MAKKKKEVTPAIDPMQVLVGRRTLVIRIDPSNQLRVLEGKTNKWSLMYEVPLKGASIRINTRSERWMKSPIRELRLKAGSAKLRPNQKRSEDQLLVEYPETLQTIKI